MVSMRCQNYYIFIHINYLNIIFPMKEERVEFVLFLDPTSGDFYSYSPSKGTLAKQENVPHKAQQLARRQLDDLKTCMQDYEFEQVTTFQRRAIPINLLIQRKFKYPVYYTQQYLPASTIESYKLVEGGQSSKQGLIDFVSAKIYLGQLKKQLEKSKKGIPPDEVTIDIKLIASVNEVIRTINRVILQDYGVVITMKNATNKLIFKVKDKNQYLYGNESIVNFQFIRESLNDRRTIELQMHEVSIYDKEQFLRYIFHRNAHEIKRGQFSTYNWQDFFQNNKEDQQFLMWHLPDEYYTHPETTVQIEKLYSMDELIRTNEKIKLKLQQKKRLQIRKIARFLWKQRIMQFIQKRRIQLKSKFVEVQSGIIYSGQCFFAFQFQVIGVSNIFSLFRGTNFNQGKIVRKKFLRFQSKEMLSENGGQSRLPSMMVRFMNFMAMKRKNLVQIVPYMLSISIQFVVGSKLLSSLQTRVVIADNNQSIGDKLSWGTLAKMPMQTSIVFKINLYAREGDGFTFGVGAIKLFDQHGFLLQGEQQVQILAMQRLQLLKMGCIDKFVIKDETICKVYIKLPKFKNNVIWTLSDLASAKLLGYLPPIDKGKTTKDDLDLQKLNQLLRYDALAIRKLADDHKDLLRKCKKYYKHQSQKLIYYLNAVNWSQPAQVSEVYTTLNQWAPLKPIEALFILNPTIADEKVRYYAVKRMQNFLDYEFVLYGNQITQALVSFQTDSNPLIELILEKCVHDPYTIAQQFFWQFKNRVDQQFTSARFNQYLQCLLMISNFRRQFTQQVRINNYLIEMNQALIRDTENLPNFKDKNKKFQTMLSAVEGKFRQICPGGYSFPIRPQYIFNAFVRDQCKMFDSKKLPFALTCVPYQGYIGEPYRVMFKYGDDLKQDNLVLQIFRIFDKLWRENGLDFKMNIYRTLSTGTQIGFIELVDAQNNSKIHKDHAKGLVDAFDQRTTAVFLQTYNKDKKDLAIAKENYLRSSAGYLVATYILGIGDRHSGNVMVQKNGKFFHIDFGHILGNFKMKFGVKRERSPVLFTSQFLYVMGGPDSRQFVRFQQYCSKAFNILRKNSYLIINLLAMMVSAQIPQLTSIQSLQYVTQKLALELSDAQAAERLVMIIKQTLLSEKSRNIDNAFHEANREG